MLVRKMVDYKGPLGVFSYYPDDFEVRKKYTPYGALQILQYKGREVDGRKIHIPEGIRDCSYMFEGKSLVSPPVIPSGVKRTNFMFLNCSSLQTGAILPYGVESSFSMYSGCLALTYAPMMPATLKNASYMFDGCRSLRKPPLLNEGLENVCGMFRNCFQLESLAEVPSSVIQYGHMYRGCRKLKDILGVYYENTDVLFVPEMEPVAES